MKSILITGVAGFIGSHAANHFGELGWTVVGVDNLSRTGAELNLAHVRSRCNSFLFHHCDIRSASDVDQLFIRSGPFNAVLHAAAQVAVTTSVGDPRLDFEINALGTFNVLEAARRLSPNTHFLYASTNKVYGKLEKFGVREDPKRYSYANEIAGITEDVPIDLYSPYGCSKGAADQYVRDYFRIYGLKTTVFRQSCIFGTRQFGVEDQGWVAWSAIGSSLGRQLSIYGDGKQVRDLLWVDDLVELYVKALDSPERTAGEVYNAGGGESNTLSIIELLEILTGCGLAPSYTMEKWRPGDQRIFIADCTKALSDLGWAPRITPREGVGRLVEWVAESSDQLERLFPTKGQRGKRL